MLDIGCGKGDSLLHLAFRYPECSFVGLDNDLEALDAAKSNAERLGLVNVRFLEYDLNLSFENQDSICKELLKGREYEGGFDFISCFGLFSWIAPQSRAHIFELFERCLSEGGLAVLSFNDRRLWQERGRIAKHLIKTCSSALTAKEELIRLWNIGGDGYSISELERLIADASDDLLEHELLNPHSDSSLEEDIVKTALAHNLKTKTYPELRKTSLRKALISRESLPSISRTYPRSFLKTGHYTTNIVENEGNFYKPTGDTLKIENLQASILKFLSSTWPASCSFEDISLSLGGGCTNSELYSSIKELLEKNLVDYYFEELPFSQKEGSFRIYPPATSLFSRGIQPKTVAIPNFRFEYTVLGEDEFKVLKALDRLSKSSTSTSSNLSVGEIIPLVANEGHYSLDYVKDIFSLALESCLICHDRS